MIVAGWVGARSSAPFFDLLPPVLAVVIFATLVAFYFRVVNNEFFPDSPFTLYVESGFFLALLGIGWGLVSGLALLLDLRPTKWNVPLACFVAVGVFGLILYRWTAANVERLWGSGGMFR